MKMRITSIILTLSLAASLQSCSLFQEVSLGDVGHRPYDAIIVPGFPFDDQDGQMNTFQRMRLFWAYHLYSTGETKNIIVSGSAVHTPYVEAEIFALYLKELGVDPHHIIIENRAEHSTENVFYSMELARHHGFERVAVATDPMQSRMIAFLLRKADVPVDYLPTDIATIARTYWSRFDTRIDGSPAFVSNFVPLKVREERKERMKGTRGEKYFERLEEERVS
ncbi:MAG: YdcF family protein, partial [Flavobacteriales bacterium]|nr:YdcF family protein [Flavobacteriales bacterium]